MVNFFKIQMRYGEVWVPAIRQSSSGKTSREVFLEPEYIAEIKYAAGYYVGVLEFFTETGWCDRNRISFD